MCTVEMASEEGNRKEKEANAVLGHMPKSTSMR